MLIVFSIFISLIAAGHGQERTEFANWLIDNPCDEHEVACQDGECINKTMICDHHIDCNDGSDEDTCYFDSVNKRCEPNEFTCTGGQCVLKSSICDGQKDCLDASDEEGCNQGNDTCYSTEFSCKTGDACIIKAMRCDKNKDCDDNSDEIGCYYPKFVESLLVDRVRLKRGESITLYCKADGVPTPVISWRLNWHHVPDKCKQHNDNGLGTLVCENMQGADSGLFSCEAIQNGKTIIFSKNANVVVNTGFPTECQKNQSYCQENMKDEYARENICQTDECNRTATYLMEKMNMNVMPCDDFYQFVCGQYQKSQIPDDQGFKTMLSEGQAIVYEQLQSILEQPVQPDDIQPIKNVKNYYSLCMDEEKIDERDVKPAKTMILEKLNGWPLIETNWSESSWEWTDTIYRLRKAGIANDYFMSLTVGIDYENSTRRIIQLNKAFMGFQIDEMAQGFYNKLVKSYFEYAKDIAVMYGADRATAEAEMKDVVKFQINLALAMKKSQNSDKNADLLKLTIEELEKKFQSIPWLEYIRNIMGNDVKITKDEPVSVLVPNFIEEVQRLLKTTPKRTLANFIGWRVANSLVVTLSKNFRNRQQEFVKPAFGDLKESPRWLECMAMVNEMKPAVAALFIKNYFDPKSKMAAEEIAKNIKKEMELTLLANAWMDEETRKNALMKLRAMKEYIGYPDELMDDNKLSSYYSKLEITDNGEFFEAIINMTKFNNDFNYAHLREPIDKTAWFEQSTLTVVDAFYSPLENALKIPAGILQNVFFSVDRPNYMNYGAIGFVIGHEIVHGFDNKGNEFDADGNFLNWWQNETKILFEEKTDCFVRQISNYKVSQINMKLNGNKTVTEVTADNGGIRIAYKAYLKWEKENSKEEKLLPGLDNFTPHQMFWISTASSLCEALRFETLVRTILYENSPPYEFRVNGVFPNNKEFSEDFDCPLGSNMNPTDKCVVW